MRASRYITRSRRSAVIAGALFAMLLAGTTDAFAQRRDSQLNLSWKDVPGARGYIVQIRDVGGKKILDRKTPASEIDFRLPPGDYTVRMAAVNKFNKPGTWSGWQDIRIRLPIAAELDRMEPNEIHVEDTPVIKLFGRRFFQSTELSLQRGNEIFKYDSQYISSGRMNFTLPAELAAGAYDLVLKNPGGKVTRTKGALRVREKGEKITPRETETEGEPQPGLPEEEEGFFWKAFVPGLPEAGATGGYLWPATIAGLFLAGGYEYNRSVVTRNEFNAHPLAAFYSEPGYLVAAAGSGVDDGAALYGARSLTDLSQLNRRSVDHANRAAMYGAAGLALYAAHALRYKLGFSSRPVSAGALLPGLAAFQEGQVLTGSAWALGFAGLTAVAVGNFNRANANVRALENDPLYRIFNEPVLLAGLRLANTNRDEITAPVYLASLRHREIETEYAGNQNRFALSAGAAALVYVTHYYMYQKEGGPASTPPPVEEGTGMRLDIYPETNGERAGTRAEFRLELRMP